MTQRRVGIAAGIIRYTHQVGEKLPHLVDHITFGSYTLLPEAGDDEPTYWFDKTTGMSVYSGRPKNEGLRFFLENDFLDAMRIRSAGCKLRISLAPQKSGELEEMLDMLTVYRFPFMYKDELEVNAVLAQDPRALGALMAEAGDYHGPKAVKIAPCMSPEYLAECVRLCEEFDFGTIVSGDALPIDTLIAGEKRLSVNRGRMAGFPLFDYTLMQVRILHDIIRSLRGNLDTLPTIIGCGGVMSAENVLSFVEAGASCVQVATYYMQNGEQGVHDLVR